MPRNSEPAKRESVSARGTNENQNSNKFSAKNKLHQSDGNLQCHCKEEPCVSDRTSSSASKPKMPLKTDFRKRIYSKYEDLLSTIFDFEENTNKRIENDQNEIADLAKEMEAVNSNNLNNKENQKEKERMIQQFRDLRKRHESEKMVLIQERDNHLKNAVVKFDSYLNRIQKAMDHHWVQNVIFRTKENKRLENEYMSVKNYFATQLNQKTTEINRLRALIKQINDQNAISSKQEEEFNRAKKQIYDIIKEIHDIHGDLSRKYRKLSEIVMKS